MKMYKSFITLQKNGITNLNCNSFHLLKKKKKKKNFFFVTILPTSETKSYLWCNKCNYF